MPWTMRVPAIGHRHTSPSTARVVTATVCAVALATGCASSSAGGEQRGSIATTSSPAGSSSASVAATVDGMFDVGGRELYLRCTGQGAPTLVLEAGEGAVGTTMQPVRSLYESTHLVCSYDRANVGRSGRAPTPRTASSMVQDLHRLLAAGNVPGPYLLVGHSAGALLVQVYARRHPEEVVGVVAMNPVPPWGPWSQQALPSMTQPERQEETAYYAGQNGETIDYRDLSTRTRTPGPRGVPFQLLISTVAQCDSLKDICGRTYAAYETIMRRAAALWANGKLVQADSGHDIYIDDPPSVRAAVDRALAGGRTKD